jgi:hypothetical protein
VPRRGAIEVPKEKEVRPVGFAILTVVVLFAKAVAYLARLI